MESTTNEMELSERVKLIEDMLAAGRRKTESWGWTFLLWGVAFYVAIAWASWGSHIAWMVTMPTAFVLTILISIKKHRKEPETTVGRALRAIWFSMGIALFLLLIIPVLIPGGAVTISSPNGFVAIVGAMLGVANGASGIILRWKAQLACAAVWWITSLVASVGSAKQIRVAFLLAIFLCQIVFGLYAVSLESRRRRGSKVVHA